MGILAALTILFALLHNDNDGQDERRNDPKNTHEKGSSEQIALKPKTSAGPPRFRTARSAANDDQGVVEGLPSATPTEMPRAVPVLTGVASRSGGEDAGKEPLRIGNTGLADMRKAMKSVGGDFHDTMVAKMRIWHLSRAGGIPDCAFAFMKRQGRQSWLLRGSVVFQAEVSNGLLQFLEATAAPDNSAHAPDDEFWRCYEQAAQRIAFRCEGCIEGRHTLPWNVRPYPFEVGKHPWSAYQDPPDPAVDTKIVFRE
jgi:hypothetical protein